jgi:signal transduction histidine kinase/ligand-binding sensor domain-containing protein
MLNRRNRITLAALVASIWLCLLFGAGAYTQNQTTQPNSPETAVSPSPAALPTPTPIQPTNLHQWGAVTLFHGLPSNRVRAIAQTTDGTMWFGTDAGLAKYDGRRTQAVAAEGLPSGRVLAITRDADGVLWIGTENGATRFVDNRFVPVPRSEGKTITAILAPSGKRALLATAEGLILDCETGTRGDVNVAMVPADPLQSSDAERPGPLYLTSLALAPDGRLLVGTHSRGILAIENGKAHELGLRPRAYFVEALTVSPEGKIIVGAKTRSDSNGLFEVRETSRTFQTDLPTGTITALATGPEKDLWIATDGRGAFHTPIGVQTKHYTFDGTAGGLRSDHIYSIFIDREEIVWFGTDRGVCRYDPHALRIENISTDPESNFIRTLFQAHDGTLLAGTNRGLFVYDPKSESWTRVDALGRSTVYAIAQDPSAALLIGASNGLFRYEGEKPPSSTSSFVNLTARSGGVDAEGSVRSIVEHQGAIYIASFGRGVERVDGDRVSRVWPQEGSDNQLRDVISLCSDSSALLIGTAQRGVFSFDGKQAVQDPALSSLVGTAIWSITRDAKGLIWFASDRGVQVWDKALIEVATGSPVRSQYISNDPEGTTSANHPIWAAASGGGLIKAMYAAPFGAIVARLDAEQGLPSQNAFAVLAIRDSQGKATILVGTNRGLARFEPDALPPTLAPAEVIGKRIYSAEELRNGLNLEYPQNSIVFNVAALSSRTFPEQFQYGFTLLDGTGKEIKKKLSHDAQFALEGLKPGRYQIRAVAYSRDLVQSAPLVFNMSVEKAPFPWTSSALAILLGMALIALWWGYWQNRRIRQTRDELALANHDLADARMDLANEAEAERRRIARDLHDQTLADLRNLMILTDRLPVNGHTADTAVLAPTTFRHEIESISTEIRRICEDLSPSALDNVGLGAALEWSVINAVSHVSPEQKFEYSVDCQDDLEERAHFAPGVRMQIYRIAQEVINNICKHSGATRVSLRAGVEQQTFVLSIEDNGRHFTMNEAKRGRGLTNIQSRAMMIEAEAEWKRLDESGMRFILRKPLSAVSETAGT